MNIILVGGAGDGGRLVIEDGQTRYDLAVYQRMELERERADSIEPVVYEVQHYNLFRLHPVTRAVIFAHESLTPTDIMERLLEGYAPKDGKK